MLFDPAPAEAVEKLMSLTRAEFESGVQRLTSGPVVRIGEGYDLSAGAGGRPVTALFVPQPDALLGGLVRLPRVLVTLDLKALPVGERADFVRRFDRVFQRGGG